MARLEIRSPERDEDAIGASVVAAHNLEILLDGQPIEDVLGGVRSVELQAEVGQLVTASVTFQPDSIEVDADVLAHLRALVEEQED